jgi:hypothetical protein
VQARVAIAPVFDKGNIRTGDGCCGLTLHVWFSTLDVDLRTRESLRKNFIHTVGFQCLGLLQITTAASTPGTHPAMVSSVTMTIDPHPLSTTARGGNTMHKMALPQLMVCSFYQVAFIVPLQSHE